MYRKSVRRMRYEAKRDRALNQAEARRRSMEEAPAADWSQHEHLLRYAVSPDGRTVAIQVGEVWRRTCSERTIRAILARAIYRHAKRIAAKSGEERAA